MTSPGMLWGTPEDLATASRAADNSVQAIIGHVNRIEGQVAVLMAGWKGAAPAAFIMQHDNWRADVQALITELSRIGGATNTTGQHQQNADDMSVQALHGPVSAGMRFA